MPIQKRPVQGLGDPNQLRRDRETLNQVLDHSFDDSRAQTKTEKLAGVTPVNKAYAPGDVRRYGADPTGTDDSYGAIQKALEVAAASTTGFQISFYEGTYLHSEKINFSLAGLRVVGYGKVVLRLTTAGRDYAIAVDAGAAAFRYDHTMRNLTIDANGNAERAFYCRNHIHRIMDNIRVRNSSLSGFSIEGDVESTYKDCMVSDNELAFSTVPDYGFLIVASAICSAVSTCLFDNVVVQCANVAGIYCQEMDNCTFTNGASEGLVGGVGVYSAVDATGNVWHNFFCEVNTTGGDLIEYGKRNRYVNCTMSSRAVSPPYDDTKSIIVKSGAEQCKFEGGRIYAATIESGAICCTFKNYDAEYNIVNNALSTGCEVDDCRLIFITSGIQKGVQRNTFTPIFGGSTGDGTITHGTQIGFYAVKDGFVEGWLNLVATTVTSAPTGNLQVKGLPIASKSGAEYPCAVGNVANITLPASRVQITAEVLGNTTTIRFIGVASGLAGSSVQGSGLASSAVINLYFRYPIA